MYGSGPVTYISREAVDGEATTDNRRVPRYSAFTANVQLFFFLSLFKSEIAGHGHTVPETVTNGNG